MATNKYPGTCSCGTKVAKGAGTVRKVGGKWAVTCAAHSTAPARSTRYNDDDGYDAMKDGMCEAGTWQNRKYARSGRW